MSKKPIKKSDMGKSWIRNRRDRSKMIEPESHLIVSEGTDTETNYFKVLKRKINENHPHRVEIKIEGKGRGCGVLLNEAKKLVKNNPGKFKHVWLVYDKDDFTETDFNDTAEGCERASNDEIKYHAMWSNECFEIWFLLHFGPLESAMGRKDCCDKLPKYIGVDYSKTSESMYELLETNLERAIKCAKKLDAQNEGKKPSECNPGTKVYKIFEALRVYL